MSEKVKVIATFENRWVDGGSPVPAKVAVRFLADGVELGSKTVDYPGANAATVEVPFGAEVPNGDITFIARALASNDAPIPGEVQTTFHVDKQLQPVLTGLAAE